MKKKVVLVRTCGGLDLICVRLLNNLAVIYTQVLEPEKVKISRLVDEKWFVLMVVLSQHVFYEVVRSHATSSCGSENFRLRASVGGALPLLLWLNSTVLGMLRLLAL